MKALILAAVVLLNIGLAAPASAQSIPTDCITTSHGFHLCGSHTPAPAPLVAVQVSVHPIHPLRPPTAHRQCLSRPSGVWYIGPRPPLCPWVRR